MIALSIEEIYYVFIVSLYVSVNDHDELCEQNKAIYLGTWHST